MTFQRLPPGPFRLIYADPPWLYDDARTHTSAGMARSAYECLPLDVLKSLPVESIAAKDCKLALWSTMPKLPQAIELMDAWGFQYATAGFVWVKVSQGFARDYSAYSGPAPQDIYSGLGHYTNANAEVVLFGTRGKHWREARNVKQIVLAPRGSHSAKPPEVRDRLVRLFGDVPRIELFAREKVAGWDAWGDEVK